MGKCPLPGCQKKWESFPPENLLLRATWETFHGTTWGLHFTLEVQKEYDLVKTNRPFGNGLCHLLKWLNWGLFMILPTLLVIQVGICSTNLPWGFHIFGDFIWMNLIMTSLCAVARMIVYIRQIHPQMAEP